MNIEEIAKLMVAKGKGILAAEENTDFEIEYVVENATCRYEGEDLQT